MWLQKLATIAHDSFKYDLIWSFNSPCLYLYIPGAQPTPTPNPTLSGIKG